MGRLFGTDGVRGLANVDLTASLALDLSIAAARVLHDRADGKRAFAVVGRDPRASGEMLAAAVCAGLAAAGVDVLEVGVLPTPALAFLTADLDASFGVMLSASHNPMPDNGLKIFAAGGLKLPDSVEDEIEAMMDKPLDPPVGEGVGRIRQVSDASQRYLAHLAGAAPQSLAGIKVVVDGANGAASSVAPSAYRTAGAEVIEIHTDPDGININDNCGSTHIEDLIKTVIDTGADVGIAHDGDADRCLAVDAAGNLIDGDHILAIIAMGLKADGKLKDHTVVTTVMSNLGFKLAMRDQGIEVVETAVGDRYVLEAMSASGFAVGGEQSGHLIVSEHATTGDGTLTALLLMGQMAKTGKSLAELAAVVDKLPQVLINVPGVDKQLVFASDSLKAVQAEAEAELGETGRVLLRPSGTEPLVRVMVEAASKDQAQAVAERLVQAVRAAGAVTA